MVDHELIRERRYLLGTATEDERQALEHEYFRDPEALERMDAAEDELIEHYLASELDNEDRGRFERDYLQSPAHRRRVETVRALNAMAAVAATVTEPPAPRRQPWRRPTPVWWSLAAAAAVLLAAGVWFAVDRTSAPASVAPPASAQASQPPAPETPAPQPDQTARETPPAPAPRVLAFSLPSMSMRGAGDTSKLVIPPDTAIVALTLENATAAGQVVIRTADGTEAWRGPARLTNDAAVRVEVPANRLPPDDYVLTLRTARYPLHVRAH